MNKIFLGALVCVSLFACKKDDEVKPVIPVDNNPVATCGERKICFDLNDTAYTNTVFMYKLDDSTYFAKYESNGKQLSIDWVTQSPKTGTFPAGDVKAEGKSRIYYFPGKNVQWMSQSGEVKITKHEGNKVSATFSGSLQKIVNGAPNGETLIVKNGVFTNGIYN